MLKYYSTLGLDQTATKEDISTAYKKLLKKKHPDKGGSETEFRKIQLAYDILYNGIVPPIEDTQTSSQTSEKTPDLSSLFKNQIILKDIEEDITIDMRDIFFGYTLVKRLEKISNCKDCKTTCSVCQGTGITIKMVPAGFVIQCLQEKCVNCDSGFILSGSCATCQNTGLLKEYENVEICIPKAIEDGYEITLDGWGEHEPISNKHGRLILKVKIRPHEQFSRSGLDLYFKTQISLLQSFLGCKITIPLFNGDLEVDTTPMGILSPYKGYVLHEQGLVDDSGKRGNLVTTFEILYPEKTILDDEEKSRIKNIFESCSLV